MKNRAVLYLRLSKEDLDKLREGDESASIKNQRLLLIEYALTNNFEVVKIYCDYMMTDQDLKRCLRRPS